MDNVEFEARVRFKRGMDLQALADALVADGAEPAAALAASRKALARVTQADRERGLRNTAVGLLLLAVGIGFTIWSYLNTTTVYLIVWGPVVIGALMLSIGLQQIFSAGKDKDLAGAQGPSFMNIDHRG